MAAYPSKVLRSHPAQKGNTPPSLFFLGARRRRKTPFCCVLDFSPFIPSGVHGRLIKEVYLFFCFQKRPFISVGTGMDDPSKKSPFKSFSPLIFRPPLNKTNLHFHHILLHFSFLSQSRQGLFLLRLYAS